MIIKTRIDAEFKEIELHVCNHEANSQVVEVVRDLHEMYDKGISVTDSRGNRLVLSPREIVSVYAEGQKVMIRGEKELYTVQKKLYELESELGDHHFVRISKSELINIGKIKRMDLSITGTIKLVMKNNYETFVSRRNVSKIKERLLSERQVKEQ